MATKRRARGEGALFQRKDGLWVAVLSAGWKTDEHGKPRRDRRTFYGETQAEAIAKREDFKSGGGEKEAPGRAPIPERQTVGDFLTWWLSEVVANSETKPRTREGYGIYVRRHVLPHLGHVPIADITSQHILDLLAAKEAEGLAPLTRRHIRKVLKGAMAWAVEDGLVKVNPVGKRVPPPREVKRKPSFLTVDEAQHLIEVAQADRLAGLYTMAVFTGMRKGEILGLHWTDINFEARTLEITRTMQRVSRRAGGSGGLTFDTPKTDSSRRAIHLSDEVVTALRAHRAQQARERLAAGPLWHDRGLVFTNLTGAPIDPTHLHTAWKALLNRAGLPQPMHFHDLRHTAASLMLHAGASMIDVKNQLGHGSIKITVDTYSHAYPEAGRALADKMSATLRVKSRLGQ